MCQKNRRKENEERLRTDCYTQESHRVDKKSGKKTRDVKELTENPLKLSVEDYV